MGQMRDLPEGKKKEQEDPEMREINKFLALLLVAAMYLVGFAFAEETLDEHGLEVNC